MKVGILHTAFIGDVILSSLLVDALYDAGHEIVYFTKKHTGSLFAPDIRIQKVVEVVKIKGLKKIWSIKTIAKQIQNEKCDILIVPHRSATSSLCAFFSKTKVTIGFQNAKLSFLYKHTVVFEKNKQECVRYLALLNSLLISKELIQSKIKLGRPSFKYPKIYFDEFEKKLSLSRLHLSPPGLNGGETKFFILALGSVWATKKYPIEQWADVVFNLLSKYSTHFCVLTGGIADKADVQNFIKIFGQKYSQSRQILDRIVDVSSQFTLFEFALFTSYSHFVLSNDSSPVHFAAAFDIPTVAVFGPTIKEFGFAPSSGQSVVIAYENEHGHKLSCQPCSIHGQKKCPKLHFKCMKDLSSRTVFLEIDKFLVNLK